MAPYLKRTPVSSPGMCLSWTFLADGLELTLPERPRTRPENQELEDEVELEEEAAAAAAAAVEGFIEQDLFFFLLLVCPCDFGGD